MAKIMITGSSGFIGGHLWRELKNRGHELIGVDLKDGKDINDVIAEELDGVDYVFHLAAKAKVPYSIENPIETHIANVNGTLNMLEQSKIAGVKKFIYSASSSAYGDQDRLPLDESMLPNPMSPYGVQKLVGEYYCRVYFDVYGMETVSLRYFNVYGEDMPSDNAYSAAIAIFQQKKRDGLPLPVLGGKQTRDFTYVGDVVRANILAMESDMALVGQIVNIGGGKNYSIDEIASAISDKIEHLPQRKGEPMDAIADISFAKYLWGWEPTQDVIEWLKK